MVRAGKVSLFRHPVFADIESIDKRRRVSSRTSITGQDISRSPRYNRRVEGSLWGIPPGPLNSKQYQGR